jgi:hypothetical protein
MLYHVRTHNKFAGNLNLGAKRYLEQVRSAINDLVDRLAPGFRQSARPDDREDGSVDSTTREVDFFPNAQ